MCGCAAVSCDNLLHGFKDTPSARQTTSHGRMLGVSTGSPEKRWTSGGSRHRRLGSPAGLAAGGRAARARCLSVGDARRGPPPQRRSPHPPPCRSSPSRTPLAAPVRAAGPSSRAGRSLSPRKITVKTSHELGCQARLPARPAFQHAPVLASVKATLRAACGRP
jgi:hypothetical protein